MSTQTGSDQAKAAGFMRGTNLSTVAPGMTFPVTWSFENSGSSVWDGRYTFVYSETPHRETEAYPRSAMSQRTAYAITEIGAPTQVPPGGVAQLTITIVAPRTAGTHATNWQLQAPDGTRFGPIRWLHVEVAAQATTPPLPPPPQTKPLTAAPTSWRQVIWSITSIFESGAPEGNPAAYQNKDAGIVSFGKHQATLGSGNLERVLQAYFQRSSSAASQALQQEYTQRVQRKEESLRHDARFKQLLLEAAQEPAMNEAQDEIFEQKFYAPILERAKKLGVTTPLGLACLYDTHIQGGLDYVLEGMVKTTGVRAVGESGASGPVAEPGWLRAFLDEREARLNRLAAQRESEGKLTDAEWLRTSTFRVSELRRLLDSDNLGLVGELRVRSHRLQGLRDKAEAILNRQPDTETEPSPVIDLLPYIKGDGRQYEIKNAWGSQERLQTQADGGSFYHVKNAQWEQFFHDDNFIYRDIDTSPGNNRFYRQKDADLPRGSRWLRRHMAVGETHTQARRVQFFNKADGSPSAQNSGDVTDTIKLVAHHAKRRFPTGIELNDVIELEWVNGRERYFYAKNYGLVGWERKHDDPHTPPWSAISEIHQPGTREPFVREPLTISW